MDETKLRHLLRRRLPEEWFKIQQVALPEGIADEGMVACVVFFKPVKVIEDGVSGVDGGWARNGEELDVAPTVVQPAAQPVVQAKEKQRHSSSPLTKSSPELALAL